ncbi:hypothetical protein GGR56DRAFT_663243 [Xylariaceae sp. FL0804]|nr:hypothetical protein GGR56DRAFT_663243 [Xylariaceae sp. FL0804]
MSSSSKQPWNTKNLGLRLASDCASAACAASLVAPIISIIDRSIMENASGRRSLGASLRASLASLAARPRAALLSRPVALIFMVYGGTYLVANGLDTAAATVARRPAAHVTAGPAKFAASSGANIGLCIYKDQVYVRLFGPSGPPRPVPPATYALFALRDCLTIFASFNVPPLLGPALDRLGPVIPGLRGSGGGGGGGGMVSGTTVAQFAAPAAVQLLSTPVHLLGLDFYNRPFRGAGAAASVSWADRWSLVRREWLVSSAARICRIVPAFGIGGTVNTTVRRTLMRKLE